MTDTESLFLVLVLIYLAECLVWVRGGSVGFSGWLGKSYQVRYPGNGLGNARGGLHLAGPLPPLGNVFMAGACPVSFSPAGVYGYLAPCTDPSGRPAHSGLHLAWKEIKDVCLMGRELKVNDRSMAKSGNMESAHHLFSVMDRLLHAKSAEERENEIGSLWTSQFDLETARNRWKDYLEKTSPIRWLANFLFVSMFVIAPWLVFTYGMVHVGWWILAGLLMQTVTLAFLFRRVHAVLYPADGESRFRHFLTMLLAPPSAIRAPDVLARPLFAGFDPLVVGYLLMKPDPYRRWSRLVWADIKQPRLPVHSNQASELVAVETWHREKYLKTAENFFKEVGIPYEDWNQPPAKTDSTHRSYCPRCLTQYSVEKGVCADCGGIALRTLNL